MVRNPTNSPLSQTVPDNEPGKTSVASLRISVRKRRSPLDKETASKTDKARSNEPKGRSQRPEMAQASPPIQTGDGADDASHPAVLALLKAKPKLGSIMRGRSDRQRCASS